MTAKPKKKPAKPPKPPKIVQLLLADDTPLEMRLEIVRQLANGEEEGARVLEEVLKSAAGASSEDLYKAKKEELANLIKQMTEGPLRQATFERLVRTNEWGMRAEVRLPDGQPAFTAVHDEALGESLRCGDLVWLEAAGKALLYRQERKDDLGDEARLERVLPGGSSVEVKMGEQGKFVFRVAADLHDQIERGEAGPGSTVIVCPRRQFAFRALPKEDGFGHFRFLSSDPVPDVVVERDLGQPPVFIEVFTRHMQRELECPEISRRYGMRRSLLRLLTGVPGTGKTYAIQGFINRMYRILSEQSGIPVDELPPRVMQLRASEVLSKWVGSSDRNIARFFQEAAELAGQPLVRADGTEIEQPLCLVIEECDALSRERGEDSIHDRITGTLLQNLDPGLPLFRDNLIFVLCTTNTPLLVDSAFVRRVGGRVESFGRLDRHGFRAVLEKQVARRPFRPALGSEDAGGNGEAARAATVDDLTDWLFGPNSGDTGVVELTHVGQSSGVVHHRRDFLTAALLDRAVQEASVEACDAEWLGVDEPGLSSGALMEAIDQQVRQVCDQLTPQTCHRHLNLPEGTRVAAVRRIEQPANQPFALERS